MLEVHLGDGHREATTTCYDYAHHLVDSGVGAYHRPIVKPRLLSRIWYWKACRILGFERAEPLSEHIGLDLEGKEATAVDSELRSNDLG